MHTSSATRCSPVSAAAESAYACPPRLRQSCSSRETTSSRFSPAAWPVRGNGYRSTAPRRPITRRISICSRPLSHSSKAAAPASSARKTNQPRNAHHMTQKAEIHQLESIEQFAEFAYAQGWTDGLPVFPPTRAAVAKILDYVGRDPCEVLGAIFPGDGEATIEKIAANCVMAGCLPEYAPIVLAAVECMVDPEFP